MWVYFPALQVTENKMQWIFVVVFTGMQLGVGIDYAGIIGTFITIMRIIIGRFWKCRSVRIITFVGM